MDNQENLTEEYLIFKIIEAIDDLVFVVNRQGIITHANKTAKDILNIRVSQAAGEDLILVDQSQGGQIDHNLVTTHSGVTYAIKCTNIKNNGDFWGTVNVWRNITGQMTLERELQQVAQEYSDIETAMQASYDGIFITDGKGTVLKFNKAYSEIMGVDVSTFLGRNVQELKEYLGSESTVQKVINTHGSATGIPDLKSGKKV